MTGSPLTTRDLLCFAIYSTNHAMSRVYRPLLKPLGITYPQMLVLMLLWERDAQRVTDLGEDLGLESNTLTPLIRRMVDAGLVTKQRGQSDERVVTVHLTDRGRSMEGKVNGLVGCAFEATGLERDDYADLLERTLALRDHVNATT